MTTLWIALAPYALVALALVLSVGLFVTLKGEIGLLERRTLQERQHRIQLEKDLRRLMFDIRGDLETAIQESVESRPPVPAPRPSLNLNRRAQVLRLARRGELPEQIAAALGVPQNEVDLLLKLHQASNAA